MFSYPQRIVPDQAQTQGLSGQQAVFDVCCRLSGLVVIARLLEHAIDEFCIIVIWCH